MDLSSSYRASVLLWLSLSRFWKHDLWCGRLKWLISDMKVCKSTMPGGMESNAVLFCLSEDKDTILGEGTEMQQVTWAKPMTRAALYPLWYNLRPLTARRTTCISSSVSLRVCPTLHASKMTRVGSKDAIRKLTSV